MTPCGYFLDVQSSALGRPWRPRLDAAGEVSALAIAQIGGQDELIARVLAGRGVKPEAVERYLDPSLRDSIWLIDPHGNLMLRWPADGDPQRMKRDLNRLLAASSIG